MLSLCAERRVAFFFLHIHTSKSVKKKKVDFHNRTSRFGILLQISRSQRRALFISLLLSIALWRRSAFFIYLFFLTLASRKQQFEFKKKIAFSLRITEADSSPKRKQVFSRQAAL